jgi:uncharacterized membrane protein
MAIADHPIHSMLLPVPVVCFTGALISDLAYANSSSYYLMWVNFSAWLILSGILVGMVASLLLLIDLLRRPALRARRLVWVHWGLLAASILVAMVNSLVHARDGYTAVVPLGLTLSAIATALVVAAGWMQRSIWPESGR